MLLPSTAPQTPPKLQTPLFPAKKAKPYSYFLALLSQPLTLPQLKSIHAQILKHNRHHNVNLTLRLRSLYPSSLSFSLLSSVLQTPNNVLTFNLLIKSFASTDPFLALHLFDKMLRSNLIPDKFTLPSVLNSCAYLSSLSLVLSIHAFSVKTQLSFDPFVISALIDAYCKCGHIDCVLQLLEEFPNPDLPIYNAAITGLSKQEEYESALQVFHGMRVEGLDSNRTTLSGVIMACGRLVDEKFGRAIHGHVVKAGEEVRCDVSVNSALVFMYPRFGDLDSAELIFRSMPDRNVVSWNAMINAHAQAGNIKEAWDLFSQMLTEGSEASDVTFTCMISASNELKQGRMMHGFVIKVGSVNNEIIGAALINMYIRLNSLVDAQKLFDEMPRSEMGSWNSLILGYSRNGHPREALNLFYRLRDSKNLLANSITLAGALSACASLGVIEEGKAIHDYIMNIGMKMDLIINTSLVNMYCKCGSLETAREVFESMREKDLVAWRVMISGYVFNGQVKEAMELFDRMKRVNNLKLYNVTFTSLLSAFSHVALLEEVGSLESVTAQ